MATEYISTPPAYEDHTYALRVGSHVQEFAHGEQEFDPHCQLCLALHKVMSDLQHKLEQTKPRWTK